MGRNLNMARLMAYARTTGSALKFEEVADCAGRVVYQAVINGQRFAVGVGKDKKEAKKNAAKIALESLKEKENQRPVETISEQNYRSLLNEYAQKNRMVIKADETPRNASPYVVGGKEYPSASGKTKKEAKEEAAKLAYHELNGSRTAEVPRSASCEAGEQLPTPRSRPDFSDGESTKMTAKRDCVASNHPNTQDAVVSGETSTGDSQCVTSFRNKSEFDFIKHLDSGGFGHVVKARDKLLGKFFAIKIVDCEDKKALREVQSLSELDHSNVIRFYSSWIDDTRCPCDSTDGSCPALGLFNSQATSFLYIQMDLCDTKTLEVWIAECNTLDVKKSLPNSERMIKGLDIVQQIVRGLEYIHSKMFIHRDLKPSNILFKGEGNIKIADFGLVTTEKGHNDENMERTVKKGTLTYMAPEQKCEKTYDRKVDIFPLGLIFFELLWKMSTYHEKCEVFTNMRRQTYPKEFLEYYFSEYMIIRPMLSVKPEDRPEASVLKTKLEEFKHTLDTEEIERRGNRSI